MSDQEWTDLENEVGRKLPSTEDNSAVRMMSDQLGNLQPPPFTR